MTSRLRTTRLLIAAVACIAALFAVPAIASAAFNVPPSTFEGGDGDTLVNNGGTDWNSPAPNLAQATDNDGGPQTAFVTGSKEQDPGNWDLGTASAPSKADILHVAYANEVVNGDLFFYGAFERLDGSGNANVSFELNKVGPPNNLFNNGNDPVPFRSEGDLLITFDGNNANGVRVGMCIWHGNNLGESADPSYGWYPLPGFTGNANDKLKGSDNCTTLTTVNNPTAIGAMNTGSITPTGLSQFSSSIADNRFGEMSVNVSQALENAGILNPCVAFGSAWIHSRSSDAPLSSMQDYVEPTGITAATPCSIDLEKSVAVQKPGDPAPSAADYADADSAASAPVADTGDTLNYLVKVTNPGQNAVTLLNDPPSDTKCTLTLVSKVDSSSNPDATPNTLDPGDVWTYSCTHVFGDSNTDGNVYRNDSTVVGAVGPPAGCTVNSPAPCVHDTDPAFVIRAGKIEIEKVRVGGSANDQFTFGTSAPLSGSDFTLNGGQTETFDHVVPNASGDYTVTEKNLPIGYRLTDLTCTDSDVNGTASTVDPNDANTAIINVESGETVHCTYTNTFTAPGIAIDKTGPSSATAGDLLPYTLTVTNPGQESLAASTVVVTDQQCVSAPVLQAKNTGSSADQTPGSLDPGDTWIYSCSGQTALGQSSFTNTACVSGTDVFGRTVSACDDVNTVLAQPPAPPVQQVAGQVVVAGEARIAGATGCVARKFKVSVRGKQIQKVEFRIDGKRRATVSKPDAQGRFIFKVDPKQYRPGSHLLVARTTFVAESQTAPKTLRLRFARCVRRTAPAFTG